MKFGSYEKNRCGEQFFIRALEFTRDTHISTHDLLAHGTLLLVRQAEVGSVMRLQRPLVSERLSALVARKRLVNWENKNDTCVDSRESQKERNRHEGDRHSGPLSTLPQG